MNCHVNVSQFQKLTQKINVRRHRPERATFQAIKCAKKIGLGIKSEPRSYIGRCGHKAGQFGTKLVLNAPLYALIIP